MLELCPITLNDAHAFVNQVHRHHTAARGGYFAIAVTDGVKIVGVCTVGRPVSREIQDGFTAEVNRLATDGTKDACSMLYAAAWRAAKAIGYRRLVTYILQSEPGTSLKAAGWKCVGEVRGRSWSCDSRPRVDKNPLQGKLRWEMAA